MSPSGDATAPDRHGTPERRRDDDDDGWTIDAAERRASPPPFNLNTISRGFTTADFYLAVPTAIVRFLESDTQTKLVAKPQLRGAEGAKLTLNLGDEVPIVSTSYTPIATGGAGVNPLNSFQLQDVGINIDITPRVTLDGDIMHRSERSRAARKARRQRRRHELSVVRIAQGRHATAPARRRVESARRAAARRRAEVAERFPGRDPRADPEAAVLEQRQTITQTDIVMLLTPHIVRAPEITEADLRPIYIGSQQNLGLGGPPPLIAARRQPCRHAVPRPAAASAPARRRAPGRRAAAADASRTTLAPPPGRRRCRARFVVPNAAAATAQPAPRAQPSRAASAGASAPRRATACDAPPPAADPRRQPGRPRRRASARRRSSSRRRARRSASAAGRTPCRSRSRTRRGSRRSR